MTPPEFLNDRERRIVSEAVSEFKFAMVAIQLPTIEWRSEDGRYGYMATPLSAEGEDIIDIIARLPDMLFEEMLGVLNTWRLIRMSPAEDGGSMKMDCFIIASGHPMRVTRYELSADVIEEGDTELLQTALNDDGEMQVDLGLSRPEKADYEAVAQATGDLQPVTIKAIQQRAEARSKMSPADKRLERMRKFAWVTELENEKPSGPRWYAVSEGLMLHAVRASSADEACAILDELAEAEGRVGLEPFFFIELYDDAMAEKFDVKFKGREIVRLIASTDIEWPVDLNSLTLEQEEALKRQWG